jgi:hypothetical protein
MLHHRLDHKRCDHPSNQQRASTTSRGLQATSRFVSFGSLLLLLCPAALRLSLCTNLFNLRVHKREERQACLPPVGGPLACSRLPKRRRRRAPTKQAATQHCALRSSFGVSTLYIYQRTAITYKRGCWMLESNSGARTCLEQQSRQ